jgi:hypothetical protein
MNKNETFNGLRDYPVTGHYFELLSTVNPVDVTLYGEGDVVLASEKQVITGYYVDRRGKEPFQRFEITTGALEAVKWFATDGTGGQKTASAVIAQTVPASGLAHVMASKTAINASTQALAANANRKYFAAQVPPTAAAGIWLRTDGGAAVAAAGSFYIAPGQSWEPPVPPTGQINMIRDGVANIDFTVIEA